MIWGGWKGHFPLELTEKNVQWLEEQGAIVTISGSLGAYTNKEIMSNTDLIFQSHTIGKITKEQETGLLEAVKKMVWVLQAHTADLVIHSQQYYMFVEPNVKVLATTTFNADHAQWIDKAVIPVVWKRNYGKGHVFYISVGHTPADFDVTEAREILLRGIRWASGSKYLPEEKWMSPVYPGKK